MYRKKQYKSGTIIVSGIHCIGILECIPMDNKGLTIHFCVDTSLVLLSGTVGHMIIV